MATITKLRQVVIKHKPKNGQPGDDPANHNKKIGPSLRGSDVLRGLTFDEEKRLLPEILGVSAEHVEWRKITKDYWNNIGRAVPHTGLILEVGFLFDSKEKADKAGDYDVVKWLEFGSPINVADYVFYRYCLDYNRVANVKEDCDKSPRIEFYIEDKDREKKSEHVRLLDEQKATIKLVELMGEKDRVTIEDVYTVLSRTEKDLPPITSLTEADKATDIDISLSKMIKTAPATFLKVANDKRVAEKAYIERCIYHGFLRRIENTDIIMYGDTVTVGNSIDEAIAFIQNEKNKDIKATLDAKLKQAKV